MCRKIKDPKDEEISRMRDKYLPLFSLEKDVGKIANFTQIVLPSICVPVHIPPYAKARFLCLFSNCAHKKISFLQKPSFVHHLIKDHGFQLPLNGEFLKRESPLTKGKLKNKKIKKETGIIKCDVANDEEVDIITID